MLIILALGWEFRFHQLLLHFGIYHVVNKLRVRDAEIAEWRRQCEEERIKSEERERNHRLHEKRLELVTDATQKWTLVNKLQEFVQAVSAEMPKYQLTHEQVEKIETLINWIKDHIQRNHPVQLVADVISDFAEDSIY